MNEYYVLIRNNEYTIVTVLKGNDPLYGHGSWSLFSGAFDTWEDAELSVPNSLDE